MPRGTADHERPRRIALAAIEVVADRGVEGLTHRRVAAVAGIPLGSTTYHFATLDDLLAAAIAEAKKARELKESAETAKKPFSEWQKLMDEMISSAEDLSKVAAKKGSTQTQAKDAYNTYNKTCTACHDVFKKDDE